MTVYQIEIPATRTYRTEIEASSAKEAKKKVAKLFEDNCGDGFDYEDTTELDAIRVDGDLI